MQTKEKIWEKVLSPQAIECFLGRGFQALEMNSRVSPSAFPHEQLAQRSCTESDQEAIDFSGNLAFGNRDCINSAINILDLGLAEKINFGVVLIWDINQKMWTNFYACHCWNVTNTGQPLDLSVHYWQEIFTKLSPAIAKDATQA